MPTELGETVVDILVQHFPTILDAEFTALMEEELDEIEEGKMEWVKVLKDFYKPFGELLARAQTEMKSVKQAPIPTDYKCDLCNMTQEVYREFGDDREPVCCQMVMTRIWSSPPVKFKGSGFYSTGG